MKRHQRLHTDSVLHVQSIFWISNASAPAGSVLSYSAVGVFLNKMKQRLIHELFFISLINERLLDAARGAGSAVSYHSGPRQPCWCLLRPYICDGDCATPLQPLPVCRVRTRLLDPWDPVRPWSVTRGQTACSCELWWVHFEEVGLSSVPNHLPLHVC